MFGQLYLEWLCFTLIMVRLVVSKLINRAGRGEEDMKRQAWPSGGAENVGADSCLGTTIGT